MLQSRKSGWQNIREASLVNGCIANLCDITGLSSRRYTGDVLEQMKKPIDYDRVDERLEKEKAISVAYIREALGKND